MSSALAHWQVDESIDLLDDTAASLLARQAQLFADRSAIVGHDASDCPRRMTYGEVRTLISWHRGGSFARHAPR